MATKAKRPKLNEKPEKSSSSDKRKRNNAKGKRNKRWSYVKRESKTKLKRRLEFGQRGILVTCNMKEMECIQESYRLLNEYADEMYGKLNQPECKSEKDDSKEGIDGLESYKEEEEEEEENISILIQKQADTIKTEKRQFRFDSINTGANNCCFFKTTLEDPKELVLKILHDLKRTKVMTTRHIVRLMPIETVVRAHKRAIINSVRKLFDKYFSKEPKTFCVIFNRRSKSNVDRDSIVHQLNREINARNKGNKVDTKNPELAVIIDVIKDLCLISVLPEYCSLKKYNVQEICSQKEDSEETKDVSENVKGNAENISEEPENILEKIKEEKQEDE